MEKEKKMAGNDNIKVVIKVRPLIKRERDAKQTSQWRVNGDSIECTYPMSSGYRFVFGMLNVEMLFSDRSANK